MSQRLRQLLQPVIESLDYELWHIEMAGAGNNSLLRIFIDKPDGITLDDCERVSREVSAVLDVEDPIPAQYRLEVSSPGLNRPLATEDHFHRCVGQKARVHLFAPVEGKRRFTGEIKSVSDGQIQMQVDDDSLTIALADIAKAHLAGE